MLSFNTGMYSSHTGLSKEPVRMLLAQKNVRRLLAARALYSFALAMLMVDVSLYLLAAGYSTTSIQEEADVPAKWIGAAQFLCCLRSCSRT